MVLLSPVSFGAAATAAAFNQFAGPVIPGRSQYSPYQSSFGHNNMNGVPLPGPTDSLFYQQYSAVNNNLFNGQLQVEVSENGAKAPISVTAYRPRKDLKGKKDASVELELKFQSGKLYRNVKEIQISFLRKAIIDDNDNPDFPELVLKDVDGDADELPEHSFQFNDIGDQIQLFIVFKVPYVLNNKKLVLDGIKSKALFDLRAKLALVEVMGEQDEVLESLSAVKCDGFVAGGAEKAPAYACKCASPDDAEKFRHSFGPRKECGDNWAAGKTDAQVLTAAEEFRSTVSTGNREGLAAGLTQPQDASKRVHISTKFSLSADFPDGVLFRAKIIDSQSLSDFTDKVDDLFYRVVPSISSVGDEKSTKKQKQILWRVSYDKNDRDPSRNISVIIESIGGEFKKGSTVEINWFFKADGPAINWVEKIEAFGTDFSRALVTAKKA